jgi:hypothetical protein
LERGRREIMRLWSARFVAPPRLPSLIRRAADADFAARVREIRSKERQIGD